DGTADYGYDATYRLLSASGLQHPGIDATTYATGFKQTLFAPLPVAGKAATMLERYREAYQYDDAGNLTMTDHAAMTDHGALSASFPRPTPVQPTSNRLAGTEYDGAGHPRTLQLASPVTLTWDSRGNLAGTTPDTAVGQGAGTERTWFC